MGGAYLSHPVTEKYSCEETLPTFSYGASSMQGWRISQEDAHNCIPQFDTDMSFFAVYDGHGGAEVAQYCAINLPDYIKSIPSYKNGNMAQALEDAFLQFDEMLTQPRVVSELKQMAGIFDRQSDTEEEIDHLFAEANMPIEEVLAKYNTGSGVNPQLAHLQGDKPQSPFLRAKKCLEEKEQMKKQKIEQGEGPIAESEADLKTHETNSDSLMVNGDKSHVDPDDVAAKQICDSPNSEMAGTKSMEKLDKEMAQNESEGPAESSENPKCSEKSINIEQGPTPSSSSADSHPGCSRDTVPSTSLGKRVPKIQGVSITPDSEESSNSEDESYEEGIPYADETDSEEEPDADESTEKEDDEDEEEESEESESEEQEDDNEDDNADMQVSSETETPGSDSGCTAVVALLRGSELYVANAGDSRCIVCRNGKAIDMSVDHKPEDELEMKRIMNAGGKVTDGRVNCGLNLSRAIGDHTYKQNAAVALKDQMISALPDIRTLTIDPEEDEFMVLACDGIWNYLSSQEVADFVNERLKRGTEKLSQICEELFDHCLAPHSAGDGTGCDNMTAIIVKFHKTFGQMGSAKRSLEGVQTGSAKRSLEGSNCLEDREAKRLKSRDDGDS